MVPLYLLETISKCCFSQNESVSFLYLRVRVCVIMFDCTQVIPKLLEQKQKKRFTIRQDASAAVCSENGMTTASLSRSPLVIDSLGYIPDHIR